MPKSDEMFGMSDILPPGMFPGITSMGGMNEPTADDMEAAMKKVRYGKYTKVKAFHAETFDLSDPKSKKRYVQEILEIYMAKAEQRGVISHMEKKLLMHEGAPKMIVHIEWYEYMYGIKDYMKDENTDKKRGAGRTGDKAGQAKGPVQGETSVPRGFDVG